MCKANKVYVAKGRGTLPVASGRIRIPFEAGDVLVSQGNGKYTLNNATVRCSKSELRRFALQSETAEQS